MFKTLFVFSFLMGSLALANPERPTLECRTSLCLEHNMNRKTLTESEMAELPSSFRETVQLKAQELASIWADTILEGDFYAEDFVRIDGLEYVYNQNDLIAYRITYSSKAWDLSNCQFDPEDMETLSDCEVGRISEAGFLALDQKLVERDPSARATFKSK